MWTAIISGICALIGGFIGAFVHRKTQHQNWLLERRAEVFADFLQTLEKCRDETSKYFRESPQEGMEKEQKIIDFYQPAISHAKITRLFLKDESKDKIDKLVNEVYAIHSSKNLGDTRIKTMLKKLEEIQTILEENLKDPKW